MDKQARIERISLMEDRFDEVTRVLAALDEAIDEYEDFKCEIDALRDYMDSGHRHSPLSACWQTIPNKKPVYLFVAQY